MKGCVRGDDNQEAMDEILMDGESDNNVRTILVICQKQFVAL